MVFNVDVMFEPHKKGKKYKMRESNRCSYPILDTMAAISIVRHVYWFHLMFDKILSFSFRFFISLVIVTSCILPQCWFDPSTPIDWQRVYV